MSLISVRELSAFDQQGPSNARSIGFEQINISESFSFGPSSLALASPAYPVTNMASADFSLRLDAVALSGTRRDIPR
jgi:hypothetical protein